MQTATYHTPVLLPRVLTFLFTRPDGVYVDATLGGGGHAEALAQRLGPAGRILGIDADDDALAFARRRLEPHGIRVQFAHDNFRNLGAVLAAHSLKTISGILFDLGVSSHQLDAAHRGFSFQSDERLDMRMDRRLPHDAAEVIRTYSRQRLAEIFFLYGEERKARQIAARIAETRSARPITTTADLARVVRQEIPDRFAVKSLARIFQALRIEVNQELAALEAALPAAVDALEPGGRVVVIAYHSLEDRIVKHAFRHAAAAFRPAPSKLAPAEPRQPRLRLLTRTPVEADEDERSTNPRARSAKLRAAEKIGTGGADATQ